MEFDDFIGNGLNVPDFYIKKDRSLRGKECVVEIIAKIEEGFRNSDVLKYFNQLKLPIKSIGETTVKTWTTCYDYKDRDEILDFMARRDGFEMVGDKYKVRMMSNWEIIKERDITIRDQRVKIWKLVNIIKELRKPKIRE